MDQKNRRTIKKVGEIIMDIEEPTIESIESEIQKLTEQDDYMSISLILYDIALLKPEPLQLEELLKEISQKTKTEYKLIKKQLEAETRKQKIYRKTKVEKPIALMTDKKALAQEFHKLQPFFYDRAKIWWFWKEDHYALTDETDLLNQIDEASPVNTIRSSEKAEIIEALRQVGRKNIPDDCPEGLLHFKNIAINITGTYAPSELIIDQSIEMFGQRPSHTVFVTNPIPWNVGKTDKTPIMDKLFKEWVGEKYVETLYELLAYCCYSEYPIQLLFCLWGNGRNGKSQFLKILDKFIGKENTTSTELDLLISNRFESFKLYKKLVCTIGETNFGILTNTSLIKKLTGGDKIGFEKKNKDPFDDYNYAKMIIASNSLPSTEDTSDGFFRRWLIVDFPNEFEDTGQEIYKTIPDEEYEALARKVLKILPKLLKRGTFTGQGDIAHRKQKYISVSNPLSQFINEYCTIGHEEFVQSNILYTRYVEYLSKLKRRKVKQKEFKSALEDEGFYIDKTTKRVIIDFFGNTEPKSAYWVIGLSLKNDKNDKNDVVTTQNTHGKLSRDTSTAVISVISEKSVFEDLQGILLDCPHKSVEELQGLGFSEKFLNKCKEQGIIFEPKPGYIKLL
jgi:P4 family phage/plasmid primase-like protien